MRHLGHLYPQSSQQAGDTKAGGERRAMPGSLVNGVTMPLMEFHISREARNRYGIDESLFSFSGNVIFADVRGSRQLAHRMNQVRGTENDPKRIVNPGALFAMGLLDEASHLVIAYYRQNIDPNVMRD